MAVKVFVGQIKQLRRKKLLMPKPSQEEVILDELACALYNGSPLPPEVPWDDLANAMKRQWIEAARERLSTTRKEFPNE